jgi:antitoxin (DNA-binding transcriptional repressor) of toxin-antitoxin stability system
MKKVSVRELREISPRLEKMLAKHGELSVTRRGKEIARVLPARRPIDFSAHEALRRSMPYQEIPSEVLIREDRDSR